LTSQQCTSFIKNRLPKTIPTVQICHLNDWKFEFYKKITYPKKLKNCNISENIRADNISIMSSLDDKTNETDLTGKMNFVFLGKIVNLWPDLELPENLLVPENLPILV
jgi:hypothetical protein